MISDTNDTAPNPSPGTPDGADDGYLSGQQVHTMRQLRWPAMPVRELAYRIGYSRQTVYAWEAGRYPIPVESYLPIMRAIAAWCREHDARAREVLAIRSDITPNSTPSTTAGGETNIRQIRDEA